MTCKKCGCTIKDGEKFCNVCGTAVNEQQQTSQPAKSPAKKKGSPVKIILPIVAVVLVAAIVIGVVMGSKSGSGAGDKAGDETGTGTGAASSQGAYAENNQPSNTRYLKQKTVLKYDYDVLEEKTVITYDQFGFVLSNITHGADGNLLESTEYITDDQGKFVEIKHVNSENPEENYDVKIEYTEQGGKYIGNYKIGDAEYEITFVSVNNYKIAKKAVAAEDSPLEGGKYTDTKHYYVDKNGYRVIEEVIDNAETKMNSISIRDGINTIESSMEMAAEGQQMNMTGKDIYNEDGFLVESISNVDGSETKFVYERNENNIPVSIVKYENGQEVPHANLVEDKDGKKVFEFSESNTKEEYIPESDGFIVNRYDSSGYQSSYKKYNANGELVEETAYRYDAILKGYYEYAG